mgnify:CR=1 FL=1
MSSEKESKTLAVINCSQLVTLAGPARPRVGPELRELGIVPNGGMLVRDGLIERVGSRDEIEPLIERDTEVVDALGRRTPIPAWLAAEGLTDQPIETSDCGVVYYSRYFIPETPLALWTAALLIAMTRGSWLFAGVAASVTGASTPEL